MADFVLGRLKFNWRGNWATSTSYIKDDIVKYGANTYTCLINHTSQSTTANFYTDLNTSAYWSLHSEGLAFAGDWASSTFYKLNDLVKYGAYQYRCILQHTSGGSFAIGSNWVVYSEGLQFEDSYNSGTTYQDGDVVTYGGYAYVWVSPTPGSGVTPLASSSQWDLLSPGIVGQGDYSAATAYKTGQTINFGGWAYVCITDTTAGQSPYTHSAKWTKLNEGFKWNGNYSAVTTYFKGDVVEYATSSYVAVAHNILNVTPGTDITKWQLLAQGDSNSVLTTRGDIQYRGASISQRLGIGSSGAILTSNGLDPSWSEGESKNVLFVSNLGSDTNPGTRYAPFKTIKYALTQASKGDIVDIDNIGYSNDNISGVYDVSVGAGISGGTGSGLILRITMGGSATPDIFIADGGSGYTVGDSITISASYLGGSPGGNINFTVKSVSVGDVVYVANGVYRENLPLVVPAGVTIRGESLRGTEVRPATGNSSTIATVSITSGGSGGSNGQYNFVHQSSSSGSGDGIVVNVTKAGGVVTTVTVYHGGYGYAVGNTITIPSSDIGGGTNLILTVASLEANNASYMWLMNDTTNLTLMTMKGLTGTAVHTNSGGVVVSLDPEGNITNASPYIQDSTSVNNNATGVKIDGNLHSAGYKSILGNDFTQINSDGIGFWANADGRGEMVSVFTYYCAKSFLCTNGGFVRGLNCSSAYGEKGAVAEGQLANATGGLTKTIETPINVQTKGHLLKYQSGTISTGTVSTFTIGDTLLGLTSGATATIAAISTPLNYLYIDNKVGNFTQGETVRGTSVTSTVYTFGLNVSFGDSGVGHSGQIGALIRVKSTDGTLSTAGVLKVGSNVKFSNQSTFYRINAVTEENTGAQTATIRLTLGVPAEYSLTNNTSTVVTSKFSNVRLTGHDFLDIGTGDFITTNYPAIPSQPADQADEVEELTGGRVYFSSTDQDGDFRVGDLFRIQQSTGIATLNADAFDLSGLTELQLGSIGAQIGATINEFSTDEELLGNSNVAVPTEFATRGFLLRDKMGTGNLVPPTGTTAERPTGDALFEGGIRYNSDTKLWEGYKYSSWYQLDINAKAYQTITSTTTITSGTRAFVDTTSAAVTITLPASPAVGDIVQLIDLAGTFDTNNLTIARNSLKIMGLTENMTVDVENAAVELVYTGSTYGWKLTSNL